MSYFAILAKWWMFTNSTKKTLFVVTIDQSCLILAGLNSRVSRAGVEQFELVWFIGKICRASGEYLWYFLHLRQLYYTSGIKAGRQKRLFESQSIPNHVHQFQF